MISQRLARLRRRARLVLTIEALAVAGLLPLGVTALFLIATLLGAGGWQTDLIAVLALAASIIRAQRRFTRPHQATIDRRIEHDSRLKHRPIAAYDDTQALITTGGDPLWRAHRARIEAAIGTARIGLPTPDLAAHDPYALRALLLLALIAAWIAAGSDAGQRLAASLTPPRLFGPGSLALQAWITPPRWTGEAPRLITPGPTPIDILTGSSLSLIVTGAGHAAPTATIGDHTLPFTPIAEGSFRTSQALTTSQTITIGPFWHRIAQYNLHVIAPVPPHIAFTTPPYPDPDGKRTILAWQANSRYGLTRLMLQFRPITALNARPDAASVPHDNPSHGEALLTLLASPYAGMAVAAELVATNKAGQTGQSAPASVVLPAPILHNKTAQALEAIRRTLALTPAARPALAASLATIAQTPPGPITPDTQHDLAAFAEAFAAQTQAAANPEAKLWTLVQRADQGAAFRAARQLAKARQALESALDKALAGTTPSAQQLQSLLAQLDAASKAHSAAQGQPQPTQAQLSQMSAISQLAQQIADEAAAGNTAQAQRDLAKLRAMLRQLQNAKPLSAAQQAKQQAAQQAGKSLSSLMRREADLMDRTAQHQNPPPMGNNAGNPPSAQSQALAQQQHALEQQLQSAAQAMQKAGLMPSSQIGQGEQAMQSAQAQLKLGNQPGALPSERAAITALQQAQNALQAMQTGHGSGSGPTGLGQRASGGHGEYGNQSHSTLSLGRAGAHSDARTIQNELIRRDAEPNLPAPAHSYYHRLLGSEF
jgi:membrane protein implicated in regulation of membrane protease activity